LRGSDFMVLAREAENGRVVGFVTAVGDSLLSAFVPLLEVLPEYQATHRIGGRAQDARSFRGQLHDRSLV